MDQRVFSEQLSKRQALVIARVEGGYTMQAIATLAGYPSIATISRWKRGDPSFALRLAHARAWGRGVRAAARAAERTFNEARAEAFLLRVRQGERVVALLRQPGQPTRAVLDDWKRQRPDFAGALKAAVRFSREVAARRWPFDPDLANRVLRRVATGERLRSVMRDPAMPGPTAIRRWRRQSPDFAATLRKACGLGYRRQRHTRCTCTPELTERVAAHILSGGTIFSAASEPGMPHYMTLYSWRRTQPDFARAVSLASRVRDDRLLDEAVAVGEAATEASASADGARVAAIRQRVGQLGWSRRTP